MWRAIFIENTTRCNLYCPSCKRPREEGYDMPLEVFKATMSKLPDMDTKSVNIFWRGEPTLDKRLPELGVIARDMGFKTYTSTNTATPLLHNKKYVSALLHAFDRICFCVDGYNQKSVNIYRAGTDWNMLIKNLETISRFKTECHKQMRTLMFRYNEGHQQKFIDMAQRYGMDSLRFGLPIINGKLVLSDIEAERWLAEDIRYQRYAKKDGKWIHRGGTKCGFLPVVSVTGDIASCCYDWQIQHSIGNVLRDSRIKINLGFAKMKQLAMKQKLSMCKSNCFMPEFLVNVDIRLR